MSIKGGSTVLSLNFRVQFERKTTVEVYTINISEW